MKNVKNIIPMHASAERLLSKTCSDIETDVEYDINNLIKELQIHQIELKTQK